MNVVDSIRLLTADGPTVYLFAPAIEHGQNRITVNKFGNEVFKRVLQQRGEPTHVRLHGRRTVIDLDQALALSAATINISEFTAPPMAQHYFCNSPPYGAVTQRH